MSNAAKLGGKREKKERKQRTKKVKVSFDALPSAIIDGKFVVPVKGRVFFQRTQYGKTEVHEGTVMSTSENGDVNLFDDTLQQCYFINLKQAEHVIKQADLPEPQKEDSHST